MDLWHAILGIGGFVGWLGWIPGIISLLRSRKREAAQTGRADDAERAHSLDNRLTSAAWGHIDEGILQVCKFCADDAGPLVGPSGQRYDLVIVNATPGMRAFFHVPDSEEVEGRSHYEVYPGICDKATGTVLRPDWVADHQAVMMGETRSSGDAGDRFTGPDGDVRDFRWTLPSLLPDEGPEPGMAAGLLMVIADRTEAVRLKRRAEAAEVRADIADLARKPTKAAS